MSGPKHLWSGDWEDESARAAARRGYSALPPPEPEPPEPEPAAEPELADPVNRTPMVQVCGRDPRARARRRRRAGGNTRRRIQEAEPHRDLDRGVDGRPVPAPTAAPGYRRPR